MRQSAEAAALARQLAGIPRARARVGEDSVGDAVLHVTRREHRLLNQRHVSGKQIAFRFRMEGLHPQDRVRIHERRVHGCAGDHAVVVSGVALDFGEALAAAGGAALPVASLRRTLVET